jgi:ribosomal protein L37AE/L43A
MQTDPALEWRRLTEHYREMSDEELRQLAADLADLTETAQQVLAQEMRSRGLGDPQAAGRITQAAKPVKEAGETALQATDELDDSESTLGRAATILGVRSPQPVPDTADTNADDAGEHDYTWRTYLCECETKQQAVELCAVLKQGGIDCWIASYGLVYPRVLVAADQLDQACVMAARPIPRDIVDESKQEVPEFQVPVCPKCGAEDPTLEGVDPANTWHCEQCGWDWTESAEVTDEQAGKSENPAP